MATPDNSTPSDCLLPTTRHLFTAWFTVYLLFLPVFLFVLYIGFNKWKKPQSSASGGLSHSDVFTLNMVAMEMICIIGGGVVCYSVLRGFQNVPEVVQNIFTVIFTGQVLFHSLTCVERYLAVVHPVTYLRLRRGGGVTIRNISIALVWVLSVSFCLIGLLNTEVKEGYSFGWILLATPLVVYCSVYVLCVLIRPKPGDGKKKFNQSKRTTVYTMMAIVVVLVMRLTVVAVYYSLYLTIPETVDACEMAGVSNVFCLPSSLVLPLLFLHRDGKLSGCCKI